MRCSSLSTRPASAASSSSFRTATAAWTTIGPPSSSAVTKCTLAPCTLAPASMARLCVSRPLNAGSSEGWILSMRCGHCATKPGVSSRMKPARQTKSMLCLTSTACIARIEGGAVLAEGGVIDQLGGDAGRARHLQARGVGLVRQHQRDLGGIILVLRRLDQRRHVGAAAGNENGDALAAASRHPRSSLPS